MAEIGDLSCVEEEKIKELERLTSSQILQHSDSLRGLLLFLAKRSLEQPGVSIKEYELATRVFHRAESFDPRLDSTVRVQTGRLRTKLMEYYAEHQGTPYVVEIPRGSYSLVFHRREEKPVPPPIVDLQAFARNTVALEPRRFLYIFWSKHRRLLAGLMFSAITACLGFAAARSRTPTPPAAVREFWHSFFEGNEHPLVVFSNAEFVGRPETGLRYFQKGVDAESGIFDHYTGVGEVMGIHELDRLSATFGSTIRVKRGRLISWDDARNSDIVFIGSPSENLSLRQIPEAQDFVFRVQTEGPHRGDLAIVNIHPRPGERDRYFGSTEHPLTDDFAVIQMIPGLTSQHNVLILAGITTLGTQAAVEYVCRPKSLEELLTKLTGSRNGKITSPFEAVIRTQIRGGVPVRTDLVGWHLR